MATGPSGIAAGDAGLSQAVIVGQHVELRHVDVAPG
jgi:hypothetical protein